MPAHPTLLPFKMHGIVSFVNNKSVGDSEDVLTIPSRLDVQMAEGAGSVLNGI